MDKRAQAVLWREYEWMKAVQEHDVVRASELLAEDFTLTSWASGGKVLGKQDYLADIPSIELIDFRLDACTAQVHDHTAVLKCRLHWDARVNGRPWIADFLITDVWIEQHGTWKVVSRHASLPSADRPSGLRLRRASTQH